MAIPDICKKACAVKGWGRGKAKPQSGTLEGLEGERVAYALLQHKESHRHVQGLKACRSKEVGGGVLVNCKAHWNGVAVSSQDSSGAKQAYP